MVSPLENLPNEIFIQIIKNLTTTELKSCRLVSSIMRNKIDLLYNAHLSIMFNEISERDFAAKRKPPLHPPFTRIVVENVSYFTKSNISRLNKINLRKEYFFNVKVLEITEFVPKHYFDLILKLTTNLSVLKVSSALLGGTNNIFEKHIRHTRPKPRPLLFLRRALPQPIIERVQNEQGACWQKYCNDSKWGNLHELHIKLDYVCPSTSNFSPLWLVENLRAVQYLPVPNLSAFSITVVKSKQADMFFFTMSSLLNTIPLVAYPSLKSLSVVSPKCRPIGPSESLGKCQWDKKLFAQMRLSELTVRICEGHGHAIPDSLLAILEAQQKSIKSLSIEGIRNAHVFKLLNNH